MAGTIGADQGGAAASADQISEVGRKLKARGLHMTPVGRGYMVTDERCNLAAGCKPVMMLDEIEAWIDGSSCVRAR